MQATNMSLDDLLISTEVDKLIRLVKERGKVEIREAAAELSMPIQSIEDWAHVLESEGLIKIRYQLTKEILEWNPLSAQEQEKKQKSLTERKAQVIGKLESMAKNVEEGKVELNALKEQLKVAQKSAQGRLEKLSADLAESEKLNAQLQQMLAERQALLEKSKNEALGLEKEIEVFQANLAKLPQRFEKKDAEEQMKNLAAAEERLETRLKEASEAFDLVQKQVEEIQKRLASDDTEEQIAQIKQSLEDFRFARIEIEKTAKTIFEESKALGENIENAAERLKALEAKRAEKINTKKMAEKINQLSKKLALEREQILGDLQSTLNVVQKQVEAYTQANYQYQSIGARVEWLRNTLAKNLKDLEEMEKTLQQAMQAYSSDLEAAKSELVAEREEYERLSKKAKEMEQLITSIEWMQKEADALGLKLQGLIKETQIYGLATQAKPSAYEAKAKSLERKPIYTPQETGADKAAEAEYLAAAMGAETFPPQLAHRVELTAQEEEEFERKRQEMALLVKKIWEEDRKPKN